MSLPFCVKVFLLIKRMSAAASPAQLWFFGVRQLLSSSKRSPCAIKKRQGCSLKQEGAKLAASTRAIRVSWLTGLPAIARAEKRVVMMGSLSYFASLVILQSPFAVVWCPPRCAEGGQTLDRLGRILAQAATAFKSCPPPCHSPERICFSGIKKVLTGSRTGVNMNKVHVEGSEG